MTLQAIISSIPTMSDEDFNALARAVNARRYNDLRPLTAAEWEARLDHSIAQANRGEVVDADTMTTNIRAKYGRTAS